MTCSCGCCDGLHVVTPVAVHNRPGLSQIAVRAGTHGRFLSTMLARLSNADYPELADLRTRDPADASIALLDAWATVADVLTFYDERIANEGYLRTATERRSLLELSRLINYVPRPGVAASVYLAFELEKEPASIVIPKGSKANSIPGPGETMEAFETSEDVPARPEWNAIKPRLTQPQTRETLKQDGLWLKGTATKLKVGDMLLLRFPGNSALTAVSVTQVVPDDAKKRTQVRYRLIPPPDTTANPVIKLAGNTLQSLLVKQTLAPASAARLGRSISTSFATGADTVPKLAASFQPALSDTLYKTLRNAAPKVAQPLEVYAMRVEARAFGHNAPLRLTNVGDVETPPTFGEWDIGNPGGTQGHEVARLFLDNEYAVADDSKIVILSDQEPNPIILEKSDFLTIRKTSLSAYGLSGKSMDIGWDSQNSDWIGGGKALFSTVRGARIFLGSELLELTDAPITEDVAGGSIELDGVYEGLDPGRWLIIEGERSDIPDDNGDPIPGIRASELVMLGSVGQGIREVPITASIGKESLTAEASTVPQARPVPGDTWHTTIALAATTAAGLSGLAYRYKRDTVTIYANVARATHGETRNEILGSGNAAQSLQSFTLKLPPLTHVSAATPSGIASTLEVRVNEVLWHPAASLAGLGPNDRSYTTKTSDDDKPNIIFGNGRQGLRLPTGRDNVKAKYRSGIGKPGNVKAGQISLLGSRPLGVKGVINPMRASGGADREGAEAIRSNAPLAILALDRLISTSDYADFARNFGGVGKASAVRDKGVVEVVIAGVDDTPIDESSDLFRNLKDALHRFGDPLVRVKLTVRERLTLVIKAGVRIDPDYLWEEVEPRLRAALLSAFAFDRQSLGAPVFLSHVFAAIQLVRGVISADVDVFDALSEAQILSGDGKPLAEGLITARPRISVSRKQIAFLTPDVPETLILQEVTP